MHNYYSIARRPFVSTIMVGKKYDLVALYTCDLDGRQTLSLTY